MIRVNDSGKIVEFLKNQGRGISRRIISNTGLPADTISFSGKKTEGRGITALLGTLLSVTGIGKTAKDALSSIPEDLRAIFNGLKNESGEEFVNKAYTGIIKHLGIEDVAPSKVDLNACEDGIISITGGFSPITNAISYSKGFLQLPREKQFNLLAHEAMHCKQCNTMVRTEGIGISQLADAMADSSIKAVDSPGSMAIFQKIALDQARKDGREIELLDIWKKQIIGQATPQMEKAYSSALQQPKISTDSEIGKKAKEYLEAFREYEGLNMFGLGSEAYRSNPLEQEAYSFGDKMEKYFSDFLRFSK